jgi:hypothetical protein
MGNLVLTIGGTLTVNQTFTIISSTGAVTGLFAQGFSVTSGGDTFSIDYGANDVVLTVVPEPSTWLGGALAFAAVLYMQRRRFAQMFASRVKANSALAI